MTGLKGTINKLQNKCRIYYFDTDAFHLTRQRQDDIISELIGLSGGNKIKIVNSLEELSVLDIEEFNFVILKNPDEVNQFKAKSNYLVFFNEKKYKNLEGSERKESLEIHDKFSFFFSKKSSFRQYAHFEEEKKEVLFPQFQEVTPAPPKRKYVYVILISIGFLILSGLCILGIIESQKDQLKYLIIINVLFTIMNVIFGKSILDVIKWLLSVLSK